MEGDGPCGAQHPHGRDRFFTVTVQDSEEAKLGCSGKWARGTQRKTKKYTSSEMWNFTAQPKTIL